MVTFWFLCKNNVGIIRILEVGNKEKHDLLTKNIDINALLASSIAHSVAQQARIVAHVLAPCVQDNEEMLVRCAALVVCSVIDVYPLAVSIPADSNL